MSRSTLNMTPELVDYLRSVSVTEAPVLAALREETAAIPMAGMQISPEQGQLMSLLVRLTGARRCIEVGVFTGYSSLAVALALPADGRIVACDIDEQWTAIARRYWEQAGVSDKIDLKLAPATETLDALLGQGGAGTFDLAFVDADKTNYWNYYERVVQLLRPGGLILVDNVLWGGAVLDSGTADEDTSAIRDFNQRLHEDSRVHVAMVPIGDGVTLALKY